MRTIPAFKTLVALCAIAAAGCSDATPAGGFDGPAGRVEIAVAPLDLPGIADACYDLKVENDSGEVVFSTRITSQQFGNGQGDATYVGPCDGSPNEVDGFVYLDLVGIYTGTATCAPGFVEGDDLDPGSEPFNDAFGELEAEVTCVPNADVQVDFNVTVLRSASQGFFDIAVSFDNIFCSAKFDCCYDDDEDDFCAANEHIDLLFNPFNNNVRDTTVVLGFACTAGVGGTDTTLLMNNITIDCGADGVATIDPTGPDGNMYDSGFVDDDGALLFEVAKYQGEESLGFNKRFWNIAIGLDLETLEDVASCTVTTRATADDANAAGGADGQHIPSGVVYPYIDVTVPLWDGDDLACAEEQLDDPNSAVTTTYTSPNEGGDVCFDHSYPAVAATGTNCVEPGGGDPFAGAVALTFNCLQKPNNGEWQGAFNEAMPPGGTHTVFADPNTLEIGGFESPPDGAFGGSNPAPASFCPGFLPPDPNDFQFTNAGQTWVIAVIDAGTGDPCSAPLNTWNVIGITNEVESREPNTNFPGDQGAPNQCVS